MFAEALFTDLGLRFHILVGSHAKRWYSPEVDTLHRVG